MAVTAQRIARAVHEANRVIQELTGEPVNPPWEDLSEDLQESIFEGVAGVIAGNTPEESHEGWLDNRIENGWVYGPVKNVEAKVHPCLVPYDGLPPIQKVKDHLFVALVRALTDPQEK